VGGGELAALEYSSGIAGEFDEVDLVELVAEVPPCVAGLGFCDADEEQGEPAQDYVCADAVFEPRSTSRSCL
jgi:hypothetical protein